MNFLIDLFRKSIKGDNLRSSSTPIKYNDQIAQLNTVNPNQASKLTTSIMNKVQKTKSSLTQSTSKGPTLPSA
jgi:hypothetical protein